MPEKGAERAVSFQFLLDQAPGDPCDLVHWRLRYCSDSRTDVPNLHCSLIPLFKKKKKEKKFFQEKCAKADVSSKINTCVIYKQLPAARTPSKMWKKKRKMVLYTNKEIKSKNKDVARKYFYMLNEKNCCGWVGKKLACE